MPGDCSIDHRAEMTAHRATRAVIALILLAILTAACGDPAWREVAAVDGGFRVLMSGDPRVEQREIDTPAGRITGYWYALEGKDSVFGVGYADYPRQILRSTPPQQMFTIVREPWLKRIAGTLEGGERQIRLDGKWSGLEFTARGELKGRAAWMRGRFYLVDNRLYQLVVFGDRAAIPQPEINRFFNSFKVAQPRDASVLRIDAAPDAKK